MGLDLVRESQWVVFQGEELILPDEEEVEEEVVYQTQHSSYAGGHRDVCIDSRMVYDHRVKLADQATYDHRVNIDQQANIDYQVNIDG